MKRGFTLIELMIVIAIIAIIAAIAVPGILSAVRAANERNAGASLKNLNSVEVTFRISDLDNNGVLDFWTADLQGLYFMTTGTPIQTHLRLIEISMAAADGNPDPQGDYTQPDAAVMPSAPKAGYWHLALTGYENPKGSFANVYGRKNPDKFAFIAVPNAYGSSGRLVFVCSENFNMLKRDPGATNHYQQTPPTLPSNDPGMELTPAYSAFPLDPFDPSNPSGSWSKLD